MLGGVDGFLRVVSRRALRVVLSGGRSSGGGGPDFRPPAIRTPLRRVIFFDAETSWRRSFPINNFILPALSVIRIYKALWRVECSSNGSSCVRA